MYFDRDIEVKRMTGQMITNLKDVVYHLQFLRKEHTMSTQGSIRAWQEAERDGGF